ncbi:DUF2029 domain-containing protein [bacterium]|nr:DUF2029 domain-containing protein [bacterium]
MSDADIAKQGDASRLEAHEGEGAGSPIEPKHDLAALFVAFLSLRLMMVWWFIPLYTEAGGFFYPLTSLQKFGRWPFLDFWVEYPPILTWLMVGLRQLSTVLWESNIVALDRANFVRLAQVQSILCDAAILALIYGLCRLAHGARMAVRACWVYLALFPTAFVALSYLDTLPVALMLGGLALAVNRRTGRAALVLGLGFMTKILPAALLPVLWKSERRWQRRLAAAMVFIAVALACVAPFAVRTTQWVRCSFESSLKRPAWQTVWALIEGRRGFGYIGPRVSSHGASISVDGFEIDGGTRKLLDRIPREAYGQRQGQQFIGYHRLASRFSTDLSFIDDYATPRPWVYATGVALLGGIYLMALRRLPASVPPRRRLSLALFSLCIFFLASKGWSPQFVAYLIPVFLIEFGPFEGGLWSLALGATAFVETPVWSHYLYGHPGCHNAADVALHVAVCARTAMLVAIAFKAHRRLFQGGAS